MQCRASFEYRTLFAPRPPIQTLGFYSFRRRPLLVDNRPEIQLTCQGLKLAIGRSRQAGWIICFSP
ncbi:Uncharacterized protein APZ42_026529 [Daphnia magna]|uniref:Uncharacterized protein n=1 Tax=Daphnia magna TaxID=35525 RepID=A0A162ED55_9CRUS|nr:Uncharacterized protein APZ42_026529 [Daphnia magna]